MVWPVIPENRLWPGWDWIPCGILLTLNWRVITHLASLKFASKWQYIGVLQRMNSGRILYSFNLIAKVNHNVYLQKLMKYRTGCHGNINYLKIPHHITYISRILYLFLTVTDYILHMNVLYLFHRIHCTIIIYSCHIYVHDTGCQHMSTVI